MGAFSKMFRISQNKIFVNKLSLQNKAMDISLRIFELLSTIDDKADFESGSELSTSEPDSESELPLECCFCAELFFEQEKFGIHKCEQQELQENATNKPEVLHPCTYGECKKVFKKSSHLRKHLVSGFNKNHLSDKLLIK